MRRKWFLKARRWYLLVPGLALVMVACQEAPDTSGEVGPEEAVGRLVSIGGGLSSDNEAVYGEILAGREGEGPVCVLPTAGANPEGSMERAVDRIDRWGGEGTARGILISTEAPERAQEPEVAAEIRECSGFFFTGGVQSRIVDVFLPDGEVTPAYEALMERFREGAVVAGSSAGAAMMSDPMIAGGSSDGAFHDGAGPEGGVRVTPGMGFITTAVMDQHFLARGRIGRLLVAVLDDPAIDVGFGIDEDTALVLEGSLAWVAGASGVVLVDGTNAEAGGQTPAHGRGLRVELLGAGDTLDLRDLSVSPGSGKTPVAEIVLGEEEGVVPDEPVSPADGFFERWVFLHRLHALAGDGAGEVTSEEEGHLIRIQAAPELRALAYPNVGVRGTPFGLSVGPLLVEIEPANGENGAARD